MDGNQDTSAVHIQCHPLSVTSLHGQCKCLFFDLNIEGVWLYCKFQSAIIENRNDLKFVFTEGKPGTRSFAIVVWAPRFSFGMNVYVIDNDRSWPYFAPPPPTLPPSQWISPSLYYFLPVHSLMHYTHRNSSDEIHQGSYLKSVTMTLETTEDHY